MWFINESTAWGLMSMLNLFERNSPFLPLYHTQKKKNPSAIFHLLCKDIRNWIPPPRMRNVIVKNHRYKLFGCLHHGWERKHLWALLKWGHLHKYFLIELFMAPPYRCRWWGWESSRVPKTAQWVTAGIQTCFFLCKCNSNPSLCFNQ